MTQITRIQDVVVPEIFTNYVINRTAELSALVESGIITQNPLLNQLVSGGGKTINMPMWKDLGGEDQVLSDVSSMTTDKIEADKDIAVLLIRGNAWASNELAGALAGSDPMSAIGDLVSRWWVRREQRTLINILNGVFASPTMSGLVADNSTSAMSADMVIDAKQLLGDAADQLQAIAMHSAVKSELQKQNLIEYIPNARGEVLFPTYLGYRVIVDDGMPVSGGVYTTYLFSNGVIARGEGTPVSLTPTEMDRDSLAHVDLLINRRAFILHPMGIRWIGTASGVTPTNDELATGTNWERVYETKQIGMVKLTHKI